MHNFNYHRPLNLNEAIDYLGSVPEGTLLAGGQTLIPTLKLRLANPTDLIDLAGIPELTGISEEDGALVDFDYREVRVAQAIIAHSRRVCLAADHSKFGRTAMVRLGDLSQIDALFTDQPPPPPLRALLADLGTELFVAQEETPGSP